MEERERLVVVGNGMAGINTIENVLKLSQSKFAITVFGTEPYPNYNRIQLSYVLEKSKAVEDIVLNDWDWYRNNNIELHTGTTVVGISVGLTGRFVVDVEPAGAGFVVPAG